MSKASHAAMLEVERTYPEIRVKRFRSRLGLTLFIFSSAIFATLPFYGSGENGDQKFHYFSLVVWVLPLAFFVIFLRARVAVNYLMARVKDLATARKSPIPVKIYLANFSVRSGRGFTYRLQLPGGQPIDCVAESTDFVLGLGYSEKGGVVIDKTEGRKLFGHKITIKPVYRRLEIEATAYSRPEGSKPFLIVGPDNLRLWLKDT